MGDFFADFRLNSRYRPEIYHCIIQRDGSPDILGLTQHRSLGAAIAGAQALLRELWEGHELRRA